MKKAVQILILFVYVFGISKLGFVYSTHNFFHGFAHEEHTHTDCSGDCTIIIDAQKSESNAETKFFKVNIYNLSTHLIIEDNFILNISSIPLFIQSAAPPLLIYNSVPVPPPIV